ncbi:hypothetical protein C2845_PM05G16310 [Panicum miliaceum]|uniref:Uncharacterized protein n=1 Tax=Panicum miliaceum TaxID=4540 RepID=A0A3L6T5K8_PANMI|nr:hypothetical protein C2845_PM05G16310 [Panicum miliaceum]
MASPLHRNYLSANGYGDGPLPNLVSDLWDNSTCSWNSTLIRNTFHQPVSDSILHTSRIHSNDDGILCWKPATKGSAHKIVVLMEGKWTHLILGKSRDPK